LKTPVAGALLTLQTLLKRKLRDSEKKELLEDGIENLKRLTSQIENLLLAGQVGRLQRFERNQTSDVVREIKAHVQRSASSIARARAKIELDLPDSAIAQIPDSLLERILDALLQNALAYSGGSPLIRIGVETEPRHILIRVHDSGDGIPQAEHENVFAPFYRLRNAQGRGTGLGLYLVRQIVQGNGGTVQINPAKNSEFIVRLRRAQ
ncbi:MAG: HAMP domain-containing histidine kinase, partial [Leptospirales bacterium]|nr:HAMP domain-containing histidine kinase [Leptospirales bacterium]